MTEDNRNTPALPDSGVPGLIDQYRQQRRVWLAQADELVRLRDEVRAAAEREAMDIVTTARRDVRQIVVEARRELMVLTAQLHAAMDAVEQSSAVSGLALNSAEGEDALGAEAVDARTSLSVTRELVLGARREVRSVLDEARAEIEALASEAPVPFPDEEAEQSSQTERDSPTLGTIFKEEPPLQVAEPRAFNSLLESPRAELPMSPPLSESAIFGESLNDRHTFGQVRNESPFISRVLSSEAQHVPRVRSATTFVALFAVVGLAVTAGTVWWLFSGAAPSAREADAAPDAVTAAAPESSAPKLETPTPPVGIAQPANPVSLTIEARRSSWIRASVDGQADGGRLYQAGETKEIVGARTVVIRAGDAGAVFVSVNGEAAKPLGANGAVLTRRYTLERASATPVSNSAPAPAISDRPSPVPTRAPATPVTLAVEKSGRPSSAARADLRPSPGPLSPASPPSAAPGPARDAPSAGESSNARPDLVVAGQQWLDAYQRRDRLAMSSAGSDNITVTDERSATERFPNSQNGVQRELDQVELALTGDTALLTARMTEKADGVGAPHVSRVSQIWVRRAGQWRLADVRIMAEARLNQIVR